MRLQAVIFALAVGLGMSKPAYAQQRCLSLGHVHGGVDTSTFHNSCNVRVGYSFCVDSPNGGGSFSCRAQKMGGGWVAPGGSDAFSVLGADRPVMVYWHECHGKNANDYPMAHARWDGSRMTGDCR